MTGRAYSFSVTASFPSPPPSLSAASCQWKRLWAGPRLLCHLMFLSFARVIAWHYFVFNICCFRFCLLCPFLTLYRLLLFHCSFLWCCSSYTPFASATHESWGISSFISLCYRRFLRLLCCFIDTIAMAPTHMHTLKESWAAAQSTRAHYETADYVSERVKMHQCS